MATYDYNALDGGSPYGSGSPYYGSSPQIPKKSSNKRKWILFGVPVGILVIAGGVVAAVLATRHHGHNSSSSSKNSGNPAAASSAISAKNAVGVFPTATNSEFMVPLYPSTTNTAAYSTPTFNPSESQLEWPSDPFTASNPAPTSLRSDRPRLIAPKYKWDALPSRIANEPYLKLWNATIFQNATAY